MDTLGYLSELRKDLSRKENNHLVPTYIFCNSFSTALYVLHRTYIIHVLYVMSITFITFMDTATSSSSLFKVPTELQSAHPDSNAVQHFPKGALEVG